MAVAAGLAAYVYIPDDVRLGALYALLVLVLPTSLLVSIVLWMFAYAVNIASAGAAPVVVPIAAVVLWTAGAVLNVVLVRYVVRVLRGDRATDTAEPAPPTEAAGP